MIGFLISTFAGAIVAAALFTWLEVRWYPRWRNLVWRGLDRVTRRKSPTTAPDDLVAHPVTCEYCHAPATHKRTGTRTRSPSVRSASLGSHHRLTAKEHTWDLCEDCAHAIDVLHGFIKEKTTP